MELCYKTTIQANTSLDLILSHERFRVRTEKLYETISEAFSGPGSRFFVL